MRNWKMQDHGRNAFAAGATPLGELTAFPRPLPGFKGGGEGREGWREGKGVKGRGGEGEGKRREGKGREEGLTPHFSLPSAAATYNNKP